MKLYIENNQSLPSSIILEDTDPAPSGYTDKTNDLNSWYLYAETYCVDYLQFRNYVSDVFDVSQWGSLSDTLKEFILSLDIYPDSEVMSINDWNIVRATYLIGKGKNPSVELSKYFALHHVKDVESCKNRADNEQVLIIVGKYISLPDASILFDLVQNLLGKYRIQGVKGVNDGFVGIGLYDFLEDTIGTVYEFAGLEAQGFSINSPYTIQEFKTELMLWFRNGKKL